MITCNHCGKSNLAQSNFCRYCGSKFGAAANQGQLPPQENPPLPQRQQAPQPVEKPLESTGFGAPRPYSWKTDEFEVREHDARQTSHFEGNQEMVPFGQDSQMTRPLAGQGHGQMTHHYRCPRCATQTLPFKERKISSAGWITFAILLVFFLPLFWIGFLIKEDVLICPVCDFRMEP